MDKEELKKQSEEYLNKFEKADKTAINKIVDWGLRHPIISFILLWLLIGKIGRSFRSVRK